jgi:Tol biopolymer transport system component
MTLDLGTGATMKVFATTDTSLGRPTWAPDGRTIAFEVDAFAGAPEVTAFASSVIAVIDSSGLGTPTPTTITDPGLQAGFPSWHPTEDRILFRTNRLDNDTKTLVRPDAPSDLYTMRSDGTGLTKLTSNAAGGFIVRAPSWIPDGRVLFSKTTGPNFDEELRILDVDGSTDTSATGAVVTVGEGRWRPAR